MKPSEPLLEATDVQLQSDLLEFGKFLSERRTGGSSRRMPQQATPMDADAEVLRLLQAIRSDSARKLFGIHANYGTPHDSIRIRAAAYIGWQMISESCPSTRIEDVARAIAEPYLIQWRQT